MINTIKRPLILKQGHYDLSDLKRLKAENMIWHETDIWQNQLENLFEIINPKLIGNPNFQEELAKYIAAHGGGDEACLGDWIYYPWSGNLVHALTQEDQFALRTNRNKQLILAEEQLELSQKTIAIAGLSVGGGMAVGLAYSGISEKMHLADFDVLETPNLNRVRAGLSDIGDKKANIVARQIWAVNPYARLQLYAEGIDETNIDAFFGAEEPVSLVFDEIDDFKLKVKLRYSAKAKRIPLVMLTGLGDSVLIDVERYDLQPDLTIFNGLIGDLEQEILDSKITAEDIRKYSAQIVDINNVPTRAIRSLVEMGSVLVGRPQLGSTVTLESGVAAFVARKIFVNSALQSGRYVLDLNSVVGLEPEALAGVERQNYLDKLFS